MFVGSATTGPIFQRHSSAKPEDNHLRHRHVPRGHLCSCRTRVVEPLPLKYTSPGAASHMPFLEKKTDEFSRRALRYAAFYGGKVAVTPKVPVMTLDDFSVWYTPGVAAVSSAITKDKDLAFDYTNRWNTIAVITDGSRVLGLGDIGPEAS